MIEIDGAQGEGGGQIVRSSIALSMVTEQPVTIKNIRAGRKKPGLMRQHLTAVKAAQQVCSADVSNASIGDQELTFIPGKTVPGCYEFLISTAGSATLVLQTVLPALMIAKEKSSIQLGGGTHNPMAPTYDYLAKSFLPMLKQIGPDVKLSECLPGFYPAGGGRFNAKIYPQENLRCVHLMDRGPLKDRRIRAMVANLPAHVARRECQTIAKILGWENSSCEVIEWKDSPGPGNAVMVELEYENITEVFTGFGERGKSAEIVAKGVAKLVKKYLSSEAPVGEYLTDQLMLPMAMGAHLHQSGGAFRSIGLSLHAQTHLSIIKKFFCIRCEVEKRNESYIVRFDSEQGS